MVSDGCGWIRLKGLRVQGARVGVYAHERKNPWPVVVDVGVYTQVAAAARSEVLGDTIDYDQLGSVITEVARSRHFDLLETLAEELAAAVSKAFDVDRVALEVHKLGIQGGATASVAIERRRA